MKKLLTVFFILSSMLFYGYVSAQEVATPKRIRLSQNGKRMRIVFSLKESSNDLAPAQSFAIKQNGALQWVQINHEGSRARIGGGGKLKSADFGNLKVQYDEEGRVERIKGMYNRTVARFDYEDGQLVKVKDEYLRTKLRFYYEDGCIEKVADGYGRKMVHFRYDDEKLDAIKDQYLRTIYRFDYDTDDRLYKIKDQYNWQLARIQYSRGQICGVEGDKPNVVSVGFD